MVGLDPGTTTGVAILDITGKLMHVSSGRNLGQEKLLDLILPHGDPAIFCTDKTRPPKLILNLARSIRAPIFCVEHEEPPHEKTRVVEDYLKTSAKEFAKDGHQIAALYSAIKGYKHFKNDLDEVENIVDREMVHFAQLLKLRLKVGLLRGIPPSRSLREFLNMKLDRREGKNAPAIAMSKELNSLKREIQRYRMRVYELEMLVSTLARTPEEKPKKNAATMPRTLGSSQEGMKKSVARSIELSQSNIASAKGQNEREYIEVVQIPELTSKISKSLGPLISPNKIFLVNGIRGDPETIVRNLKRVGVSRILYREMDEAVEEVFIEQGVSPISSRYLTPFEEMGKLYVSSRELALAEHAQERRVARHLIKFSKWNQTGPSS